MRSTWLDYEIREGDLVRHPSCAVPIRVIGVGPTIAVAFPNGDMQAFEPFELEKVLIDRLGTSTIRP
jgi:hypothetical protein